MSNVGTRGSRGGPPESYRRFLGFICWRTTRDERNMMRVVGFFVLGATCTAGVYFTEIMIKLPAGLAWTLAFVPALPGIGAVLAYVKFLREADEMIRQIHLIGLAVGFAAGILVSTGMLPPILHDPTHKDVLVTGNVQKMLVTPAMIFGWVAGQIWAAWRFK